MTKKHIDNLTLTEVDYAVAVRNSCIGDYYHPTTNQEQCGHLIDEFKINLAFYCEQWNACFSDFLNAEAGDQSRLVAACKAFLWSKYPDGMVEG